MAKKQFSHLNVLSKHNGSCHTNLSGHTRPLFTVHFSSTHCTQTSSWLSDWPSRPQVTVYSFISRSDRRSSAMVSTVICTIKPSAERGTSIREKHTGAQQRPRTHMHAQVGTPRQTRLIKCTQTHTYKDQHSLNKALLRQAHQ